MLAAVVPAPRGAGSRFVSLSVRAAARQSPDLLREMAMVEGIPVLRRTGQVVSFRSANSGGTGRGGQRTAAACPLHLPDLAVAANDGGTAQRIRSARNQRTNRSTPSSIGTCGSHPHNRLALLTSA